MLEIQSRNQLMAIPTTKKTRRERERERILYHWSMRRDYPENMSITSVVHWIPCRLRGSPPAKDCPLILSEQSDVSNGRARISSLPKLCKRKSLPISYGKLRMELFVKFNSRSFTKSPRHERKPLNFSILLSSRERSAGFFSRELNSIGTRASRLSWKSTRVCLIESHLSNTHSRDRLFFRYCAVNICISSSRTNLPISDGKFLNLFWDKSSETRFVRHAISDGNRDK